jgi:hypothetical protein
MLEGVLTVAFGYSSSAKRVERAEVAVDVPVRDERATEILEHGMNTKENLKLRTGFPYHSTEGMAQRHSGMCGSLSNCGLVVHQPGGYFLLSPLQHLWGCP